MKQNPVPLKYTGKCIKMDDRTWELFKKKRKDSGLSWNRYIYQLLTKHKDEHPFTESHITNCKECLSRGY